MAKKTQKGVKGKKEHTAPWECTIAKEEKSTCNPGTAPKSDGDYFEILCLCVLQAGLGWGMVRRNWGKFKLGFLGFEIHRLAHAKVDELLENTGVIRNRNKITAIINNAKEFQEVQQEYSSFSNFLDSLREGSENEALNELTRRFHHLGKYSAEYFLHSVGYLE